METRVRPIHKLISDSMQSQSPLYSTRHNESRRHPRPIPEHEQPRHPHRKTLAHTVTNLHQPEARQLVNTRNISVRRGWKVRVLAYDALQLLRMCLKC